MKSRDFCYWLQGYFELNNLTTTEDIPKEQVQVIKNHLAMVFKHEIDPSHGDQNMQNALNHIHSQLPDGVLARC